MTSASSTASTFPKLPDTRDYHRQILSLQRAAENQAQEVQRISSDELATRSELAYLQRAHTTLLKNVQTLKAQPLPREKYPNGAMGNGKIVSISHTRLTKGLSDLDAAVCRVAKDLKRLGREIAFKNHLQTIAYEGLPPCSKPVCADTLMGRAHKIAAEFSSVVKRDSEINTSSLHGHVHTMQSRILEHASEFENAHELGAEWDRHFARYVDELRIHTVCKEANLAEIQRLDSHYQPLLLELRRKAASMATPSLSGISKIMKRADARKDLLKEQIIDAQARLRELRQKPEKEDLSFSEQEKLKAKLGCDIIRTVYRREIASLENLITSLSDTILKLKKPPENAGAADQIDERLSGFEMQLRQAQAKKSDVEQKLASELATLKNIQAAFYRRNCRRLENGIKRQQYMLSETIAQATKELEAMPLKIQAETTKLLEAERRKMTDEHDRLRSEYERMTNTYRARYTQAQTRLQLLEEEHAKSSPEIQDRYLAAEKRLNDLDAQRKSTWERLHHLITPVVRTPSPATSSFSPAPASRPRTSPTLPSSVQCVRFKSRLYTA